MRTVSRLLQLFFLSLILSAAALGAEYSDLLQEAVANIELGKYDDAFQAVEQAFALNSSDLLGHLALGTIYLHVGNLSDAEKEYHHAIAANPNEWRAHYALAICALLKGDRLGMEKWAKLAEKINNSSKEISLLRCYLDYVDGKAADCIAPESTLAKQIRAMAKLKAGDIESASNLLVDVLQSPAPPGFEEFRAPIATFDKKQPIALPNGKLSKKHPQQKNAPVVSGIVTLTADASKLEQVAYVVFFVDKNFVGVTNYSPFRFDWNTLNHPNGLHEVEIEARDQNGAVVSRKSTWVRIENANPVKFPNLKGPKAEQLAARIWNCIRLTESRKLAHYELAKIFLKIGDKENAAKHFEYTVAYDSNFLDARDQLIILQGRKPEYAELRQGPAGSRMVAITFDDGPNERTEETLNVLRKLGIRATFFLVGFRAEAQPELVKLIEAGGHQIENHTYSHENLANLSQKQVEMELAKGAAVIRAITGRESRFFRPPGGHANNAVLKAAARLGLTGVFWSINCTKYEGASHVILARSVVDNVNDGAIILMHNGEPATLSALPQIVSELRSRGYRFVTIAEMMEALR
ncbi:MAG: polysaccharide deacetylase family protein [Armatimonadota bacterium]|nr:polysaccharide deacetylase family protein [Armatimonadota bacterium]